MRLSGKTTVSSRLDKEALAKLELASLEGAFGGPFETLRKTAKAYQGKDPEILEEILYEIIIDFQVKLEKALP